MTGRLIGIVGRARSGKDTIGTMLTKRAEKWTTMAFAEPLKRICGDVYLFSAAQLYGNEKEIPDKRYPRSDGSFLTPREAMQRLGTEWARVCYPNTWVDWTLRHAAESRAAGWDVAITDVRFVNEATAIKAVGGVVWRVLRSEADRVPTAHPSETEMNRPEMGELVDKVIVNDGTLEDLLERVKAALDCPPSN